MLLHCQIKHMLIHACISQGVVKPDIVFFGEQLPKRFFMFGIDMPQADLLIVMGTSLEVRLLQNGC